MRHMRGMLGFLTSEHVIDVCLEGFINEDQLRQVKMPSDRRRWVFDLDFWSDGSHDSLTERGFALAVMFEPRANRGGPRRPPFTAGIGGLSGFIIGETTSELCSIGYTL